MKRNKRNQSNLDEMQELKLLKIEEMGYQLAFWGLIAAIMIQIAMGNGDFPSIAGECLILMCVSVYMVTACVKNGIWERRLKPNAKTNALFSMGGGAVVGLVWGINSYRNYHKPAGSAALFVLMFLVVSALCFGLLSLVSSAYKKRSAQLEQEDQNKETE